MVSIRWTCAIALSGFLASGGGVTDTFASYYLLMFRSGSLAEQISKIQNELVELSQHCLKYMPQEACDSRQKELEIQLDAKQHEMELRQKELEIQLNAKQKEMESIESAEDKQIKSSIPKLGGR